MHERIKADSLTVRYGRTEAVAGVSFSVYEGEVLGVFGLSGSGKTTLVRALAGLIRPDSGEHTIDSPCPPGLWLDQPALDPEMTPFETLWMHAALYGIPRGRRHSAAREMLNLVELDELRDQRIHTFSAGMQRRLEAARALLSPSPVLLADEPMAELDTRMRSRLWQYLLMLRTSLQRTILVATSRTEDAEVCDRIALLHEGRVLSCGTLSQLRGAVGPEALVIRPMDDSKISPGTRGWRRVSARDEEESLVVEFGPDTQPVDVLREVADEVNAVRVKPRGLDSVLLEMIARNQEGVPTN